MGEEGLNIGRIPREGYLSWLRDFRDKPIVKVVTGLRRSGKSTILAMFMDELRASGVERGQILSLNFEEMENELFLERHKLYERIIGAKEEGKRLYVFLDEIQHVAEYEKVIDSLQVKAGFDIYMTGSTADLLSSELATRLTGRYVEINVLPLSFKESVWDKTVTLENREALFREYLTYGGLPGARLFPNGSRMQREYVESVYRAILEKDVLKRSRQGRFLVDRIIRYLLSAVGSLTSPKRMVDRLGEEAATRNEKSAAYHTLVSYLERLTDCFFVYKPDRYDIVGGELLKQINKYYITDFGFIHYLMNAPTIELQQLLENVVYFELKRRRYKVCTGKADDKEVDFVVQGDDGCPSYIQVAVSVKDEAKLKQELAVFEKIKDNYPKCIITMDQVFVPDHGGVKTISVYDFLMGECWS